LTTVGSLQFQRVSKKRPCPICGKADWCLVSSDGAVAVCQRIEAGAIKRCGDAGWLHRLNELSNSPNPHSCHRVTLNTRSVQATDLEEYAAHSVCRASSNLISRLAADLGVSAESLRKLSVGWDGGAWVFPMRDHEGRIIGIRRRFPDGAKRAVLGSRNGLFIPTDLRLTGQLLIAEGESDCAALLSLDLNCIGRPSCLSGGRLLSKLAHGRDTVIVADRDDPGQRGAARLASVLICHCPSVRIVTPPAKDARDWIRGGAKHDDVASAIDAAPILRLRVRARSRRRGGRPAGK